jgi:hypothetical protein
VDDLLEPPDGFQLDLPLIELTVPLFRVHPCVYDAVYFDVEPTHRFNAPSREYGVLYASQAAEGAFAEGFLRARRRPPRVSESDLRTRAMSELAWDRLRLADFTSPTLTTLGLDARIASGDCYALAQRWARWVHAHPAGVDGICYLARHAPTLRSVALFDRIGPPAQSALVIESFMPAPGRLAPGAARWIEMFKVAIV